MEEPSIANHHLKIARDSSDQDYEAQITKLNSKESSLLTERLIKLNKKKLDHEQAGLAVVDYDLIEVNAGGRIIATKSSIMTQLKGSQFEASFSGRWDNKLQQDSNGHIFCGCQSCVLSGGCGSSQRYGNFIAGQSFQPSKCGRAQTHSFFSTSLNCLGFWTKS